MPQAHKAVNGKYNPKVHKQIIEDLKKGAFKKAAAARAGVSITNMHRWERMGAGIEGNPESQARYRSFHEDVQEALAIGEQTMLDVWQECVVNGDLETSTEERFDAEGEPAGKTVRTTRKKSWRGASELLARRHAMTTRYNLEEGECSWGPKQAVKHEGQVEIRHKHVTIHTGEAPHPEEEGAEPDA